jgi:hypothetical protein
MRTLLSQSKVFGFEHKKSGRTGMSGLQEEEQIFKR